MSDFAVSIAPFFNELENHSVVSEFVGFAFSLFLVPPYPEPANHVKLSYRPMSSIHCLDEEHVNSGKPNRKLKNTFCQLAQKSMVV